MGYEKEDEKEIVGSIDGKEFRITIRKKPSPNHEFPWLFVIIILVALIGAAIFSYTQCSGIAHPFEKTGIITDVKYGYTDGGLNWWWTYPFPEDKDIKRTRLTFEDGTIIEFSGYPLINVIPGNEYRVTGIRHRYAQLAGGYTYDIQNVALIAK
jgi:hypothetical protein